MVLLGGLYAFFTSPETNLGFLSVVLFVLMSIALIFFFYGFVVLGKKYNKKLIKVISWVFIVITVLGVILQIVFLIFPDIWKGLFERLVFVQLDTLGLSSFKSALESIPLIALTSISIIGFVFSVLNILLGFGILKLKGQVGLAKPTGILLIIGSFTLIIGIGVLVLLVGYIFEIIMLFKADGGVKVNKDGRVEEVKRNNIND